MPLPRAVRSSHFYVSSYVFFSFYFFHLFSSDVPITLHTFFFYCVASLFDRSHLVLCFLFSFCCFLRESFAVLEQCYSTAFFLEHWGHWFYTLLWKVCVLLFLGCHFCRFFFVKVSCNFLFPLRIHYSINYRFTMEFFYSFTCVKVY